MCYQKSLNQSEDNLTRYMDRPPYTKGVYEPYYLNDGFAHKLIYIIPQNSPNLWYPANWGLIPDYYQGNPSDFYKDGKYNTLNARDDKVFYSNVYRNPIREGRCLIYCDGFFEPHHYGKQSQPYFCYLEDSNSYTEREIFCFAGIYTTDGEGSYYTSLITTEANPLFEKVHNKAKRMPLTLDRKYEEEWIKDGQSDSVIKGIMAEGFTSKSFTAHPVMNYRLKVNREYKNTSQVLQPANSIDPNLKII